MRCPSCQFENRPRLRFCENCGANLPAMAVMPPAPSLPPVGVFCRNCGAQNRPGAQFCGTCGASLYGVAPVYQPARPAPPSAYSYQRGPSLGSAIASSLPTILILLILGGIVYYVINNVDKLKALLPKNSPIVIMIPTTSGAAPVQNSNPSSGQPASSGSSSSTGSPTFTPSQDSLCRAGPSQIYDVSTSINSGQAFNIIGKSGPEWEDWWQVSIQGVKCWIWSGLGSVSGDISQVNVVDAPAIPQIYLTIINRSGFAVCEAYLQGYEILGGSVLFDGKAQRVKITPGDSYSLRVVYQGELNPCGSIGDDYFQDISCKNADNCYFNIP